jgi:tetratricopeptide (TPR) repeat protein
VRGDEVSTATDVYALGVLLDLLLTGARRGAEGPAPAGAGIDPINVLFEREPPAPSVRAARVDAAIAARRALTPRQLAHVLRGDLDNVIAKACRPSPVQRYPTVTALAEDLRRHLDQQPVRARADSFAYRAAKFVRRNRWAVGTAAGVALVVLASAVGMGRQSVQASRARDAAVAQLQRAEATNRLLSVLISEVSAGGASFTPGELLARAERWADRLYADDPRLHAEMLLVLGDRIDHTDGARARAWYEQAQRLAEPLGDPELTAAAACRVAVKLAVTGTDVPRARAMIDSALRAITDQPPGNAVRTRCWVSASYVAAELNEPTAVVEFAERAVAEAERGVGPPLDRLLGPVGVLASAYQTAGRYHDAQREHERGLAILNASGLGESVRAATALNNAALNLMLAGAVKDALEPFERTIALDRSGGARKTTSTTASNYALALTLVGRTDEAITWSDFAIAEARRQIDERALWRALLAAARAQLQAGDLRRAEVLLKQTASALAASAPPGHVAHAALRSVQGSLAAARGDLQLAQEALIEAAQMYAVSGPRMAGRAITLAWLADVHTRRGESAAALARAEEALALARELSGDFPYSYSVGLAALAVCNARAAAGAADAVASCELAVAQLTAAIGESAPTTRRARDLRARLTRRTN